MTLRRGGKSQGRKCAAKNRQKKPCARPAGWGTDHAGEGRCKLHGGSTPIKHGRYSQVARARLGPELEKLEADPDPLNLLPDLALVRAHAAHFLEKHGPSPLVADFLSQAARLVEAIQRQRKEGVVTMATLQRVVEQMGVVVARHVKDPKILAAIERDWDTLALG